MKLLYRVYPLLAAVLVGLTRLVFALSIYHSGPPFMLDFRLRGTYYLFPLLTDAEAHLRYFAHLMVW